TSMDIDRLKEWESSLEAEVLTIRERIQSLNAELQRKSQQTELIRRLIESASGSSSHPIEMVARPNGTSASPQVVTPNQVKDHAYEILRERKGPMNINEIHGEFLRRGYPIPGKGTSFNILVHVSRELKLGKKSRFYRAGRGTYGLRP